MTTAIMSKSEHKGADLLRKEKHWWVFCYKSWDGSILIWQNRTVVYSSDFGVRGNGSMQAISFQKNDHTKNRSKVCTVCQMLLVVYNNENFARRVDDHAHQLIADK